MNPAVSAKTLVIGERSSAGGFSSMPTSATDLPTLVRLFILLAVLTAQIAFQTASAGTFDDGVEEYLAGRYAQAMKIWQPLADDGDAVAMFNIGVLHAQGLGLSQDATVAVDWYRKAADRGYAPAQFNLGASYHNGHGVKRNDELAASWWQLAADQGEVQAQYHLAVLYLEGRGVDRDPTTAKYFLEQAARQGESRASELLATLKAESTTVAASSDESGESMDRGTGSTQEKNQAEVVSLSTDGNGTDDEGINVAAGTNAVGNDNDQSKQLAFESKRILVADNSDNSSANDVGTNDATSSDANVVYSVESSESSSWVNDYDPGSFTIQILATKEKAAAERFIKEHGLAGRAQVFFAGGADKPLYKVIYGNYESAAQAKRERGKLPEGLKVNTPWIRNFASIQAEAVPSVQLQTAESVDKKAEPVEESVEKTSLPAPAVTETAMKEEAKEEPKTESTDQVTEVASSTEPTGEADVNSASAVEVDNTDAVSVNTTPGDAQGDDAKEQTEATAASSESAEEIPAASTSEVIEEVEVTVTDTNEEQAVTDEVVQSVESSSVDSETQIETVLAPVEETESAVEIAGTEATGAQTLDEQTLEVAEAMTDGDSGDAIDDRQAQSSLETTPSESSVVAVIEDDATEQRGESAPAPDATTQIGAISTEVGTAGGAADQTNIGLSDAAPGDLADSETVVQEFTLGQRAFNRQDYDTALQHWRPLAEAGHAEAQYGLGFMYETGWGVQRAASEALEWYRKSAEQGYAKAQYNLGMMYLVGNGVDADESMGLFWIQSAADQNDLRARARLSRIRANSSSN